MKAKEQYMEELNTWIMSRMEEMKLKLLLEVDGIQNIEKTTIKLKKVYFKNLESSNESAIDKLFTSLTHVFAFNDQEFELECLGRWYYFNLFSDKDFEIRFSDHEGLEVLECENNGIYDEDKNMVFLLIDILENICLTDKLETVFLNFHHRIEDQENLS